MPAAHLSTSELLPNLGRLSIVVHKNPVQCTRADAVQAADDFLRNAIFQVVPNERNCQLALQRLLIYRLTAVFAVEIPCNRSNDHGNIFRLFASFGADDCQELVSEDLSGFDATAAHVFSPY